MTTSTETTLRNKLRPAYHRWRKCPIRLEADDFARLCHAAGMRGVGPLELLERIVSTTLRANLINAVLDDDR
jgi:hypothetical protein